MRISMNIKLIRSLKCCKKIFKIKNPFKRELVIIVVCSFFYLFCPNAYGETLAIATFGDSITLGYPYFPGQRGNGSRDGGYQPFLEILLQARQGRGQVFNYGVGGESSSSGVNRISVVLQQKQFSYMLLLEGTNDLSVRPVSSQTVRDNLRIMIEKCRARGVEPLVATLTPDWGSRYKPIASKTNPLIRELAEEQGVVLCDLYLEMVNDWENLSDDELHPNRSGYRKMAEVWFAALIQAGVLTYGDIVPIFNLLLMD